MLYFYLKYYSFIQIPFVDVMLIWDSKHLKMCYMCKKFTIFFLNCENLHVQVTCFGSLIETASFFHIINSARLPAGWKNRYQVTCRKKDLWTRFAMEGCWASSPNCKRSKETWFFYLEVKYNFNMFLILNRNQVFLFVKFWRIQRYTKM